MTSYDYNFWILYFIIPNHNKNKLHLFFFFWRKNDQLKLKSSFGLFSFNQCFFLVSFKLGFQWIGFDNFLLVNWSKNRLSWARGTCVLGLFFVHAAFHNNRNKKMINGNYQWTYNSKNNLINLPLRLEVNLQRQLDQGQ